MLAMLAGSFFRFLRVTLVGTDFVPCEGKGRSDVDREIGVNAASTDRLEGAGRVIAVSEFIEEVCLSSSAQGVPDRTLALKHSFDGEDRRITEMKHPWPMARRESALRDDVGRGTSGRSCLNPMYRTEGLVRPILPRPLTHQPLISQAPSVF